MERKKRIFKIQNLIILTVVGIFCFSLVPTVFKKGEEESIRESLMNSFSMLGSMKQKGEDKLKKTTKKDEESLVFSSQDEEDKDENREENDKKIENDLSVTPKKDTDEKNVSHTPSSSNPTFSKPNQNTKPEETENKIDGKAPIITFTNTPTNAENGYVKKQIAHIRFSQPNLNYYVKTSKVGISDIALLESCGSKEKPENCIKIANTKTLKANTWYKVGGNVTVTYEEDIATNERIYAIEEDKQNFSTMAEKSLLKISNQPPTKPFVLNPTGGQWTKEDIRLTLTSNDKTGIAYWEYSYDNRNFTKYSNSAMSTFITPLYEEEQDRILYVRACNYLGFCSESTNTRLRIEKATVRLFMGSARYTITPNSIRFFGVETYGVKSGIRGVTCKYSTTKGSYIQNASSVVGNACEMKNLKSGTNYYFEYCVITNAGNKSCAYGSAKTKIGIATSAMGKGNF